MMISRIRTKAIIQKMISKTMTSKMERHELEVMFSITIKYINFLWSVLKSYARDHNFRTVVQNICLIFQINLFRKVLIFFLIKDIDEWNILSLKNNIIVKKKRSKIEDEIYNFFSRLFGIKDFISQENPILADIKNIIL